MVGPLRSEADMRRAMPFSEADAAASRNSNPIEDANRAQRNLAELKQELGRTKDPEVRKILMEEFNRQQGPTADSGDAPLMDLNVLGGKSEPAAPAQASDAPLMNFSVLKPKDTTPPDVTASPAQAAPGAPQFVGTNAGAATGIERPRLRGPEPVTPEVGPAEKRTASEAGGMIVGAAAGSFLGGPGGEPLGAGVGATAGSLLGEMFDPTTHPIKEALQTGATAAATAGVSALGVGGLRSLLGKPTERGQALLDIMEARGLVPPAGAVLSGSLVKNMEAIGSADAFFGQKVKDMISDTGGVVTDDLRNFISGYQRFYGAAKEGFKIFDAGAKEAGTLLAIDTPILDKLKSAERVWSGVGSKMEFPLRSLLDKVAADEAMGIPVAHVGVSFEQAEAIRQLLHEQANALSGSARAANSQAVGKDVVQSLRQAANKLGDEMEAAVDNAVRDGRIPLQTRQILAASKDMWKQWKIGETLQDALGAQLKTAGREGAPITSDAVRGALTQIEADGAKLHRSLISPGETSRLEAIANALQANEAAGKASQFTMAVRSGQLFTLSGAGVAAGAGNPIMAGAGAAVTLIPAAMGFIVRNPTASALLIRGLRLPAGSAAAIRASRDLTTMLAKEGFIAPVERTADSVDQ